MTCLLSGASRLRALPPTAPTMLARSLPLAFALATLGCSSTHPIFRSQDASLDAALDAGPVLDAALDAGPVLDAGVDAGRDGGPEICPDAVCDFEVAASLQAPGTRAQSRAGSVVALSDDGLVLAVGAPGDPSRAHGLSCRTGATACLDPGETWSSHGSVQIWTSTSSAGWEPDTYIKAPESLEQDYFGRALALSGDGSTLAVGVVDESRLGAIHVYEYVGGLWTFDRSLVPPGAAIGDGLGDAIALSYSGDTLVVGAPGESSDTPMGSCDGEPSCVTDDAEGAGAAHVFTRAGGEWSYAAYLKAPAPGASDAFGTSVDLAGELIVVGAPGESTLASDPACMGGAECTDEDASGSGALYVYQRDGESWAALDFLKSEFPFTGAGLGQRVRMVREGELIVAASPFVGAYAGEVHVFERTSDVGWRVATSLGAPGAIGFGAALASDAEGMLLAFGDRTSGDQLLVYRRTTTGWVRAQSIHVEGLSASEGFPESIDLSADGSQLVVGVAGDDGDESCVRPGICTDAAPNSGLVLELRL